MRCAEPVPLLAPIPQCYRNYATPIRSPATAHACPRTATRNLRDAVRYRQELRLRRPESHDAHVPSATPNYTGGIPARPWKAHKVTSIATSSKQVDTEGNGRWSNHLLQVGSKPSRSRPSSQAGYRCKPQGQRRQALLDAVLARWLYWHSKVAVGTYRQEQGARSRWVSAFALLLDRDRYAAVSLASSLMTGR